MRYYSTPSPGDQIRALLYGKGIPATTSILLANILTFLIAFFFHPALRFLVNNFVFSGNSAFHSPWTLFTYPLATLSFSWMSIISLIFFWLTAGSLERAWGSRRFTFLFFPLAAVSAASLLVGAIVCREPLLPLSDIFLPLMGLIVAFCMINPQQLMSFWGMPIQARWVAVIAISFNLFSYGQEYDNPLMGAFACGGILVAALYMRYGRSWATTGYGSGNSYRSPKLRMSSEKPVPPAQRATLDGSIRRKPYDLIGKWKDRKVSKGIERLLRNSDSVTKNRAGETMKNDAIAKPASKKDAA